MERSPVASAERAMERSPVARMRKALAEWDSLPDSLQELPDLSELPEPDLISKLEASERLRNDALIQLGVLRREEASQALQIEELEDRVAELTEQLKAAQDTGELADRVGAVTAAKLRERLADAAREEARLNQRLDEAMVRASEREGWLEKQAAEGRLTQLAAARAPAQSSERRGRGCGLRLLGGALVASAREQTGAAIHCWRARAAEAHAAQVLAEQAADAGKAQATIASQSQGLGTVGSVLRRMDLRLQIMSLVRWRMAMSTGQAGKVELDGRQRQGLSILRWSLLRMRASELVVLLLRWKSAQCRAEARESMTAAGLRIAGLEAELARAKAETSLAWELRARRQARQTLMQEAHRAIGYISPGKQRTDEVIASEELHPAVEFNAILEVNKWGPWCEVPWSLKQTDKSDSSGQEPELPAPAQAEPLCSGPSTPNPAHAKASVVDEADEVELETQQAGGDSGQIKAGGASNAGQRGIAWRQQSTSISRSRSLSPQ